MESPQWDQNYKATIKLIYQRTEKNKKVENNTLYTRCPTCSIAFKVTQKLLSAAGGKVRCGACLAIFQATDYMLKPSERTKPIEPLAAPQQASQTAGASLTDKATDSGQATQDQVIEPHHEASQSEPDLNQDESKVSRELETDPLFDSLSGSSAEQNFEIEPRFEDTSQTEQQQAIASGDFPADPEIDLDVVTNAEQHQPEGSVDSQIDTTYSTGHTEPSLGELDDFDPMMDNLVSDNQEILNATTGVSTEDLAEHNLNLVDDSLTFEPNEEFEVDDLSVQLAEQMQDTDAEPDPLDEFEDIVEEKNTSLRRNIILAATTILVVIGLQQVWSNRQALAWSESWGNSVKSVCQYLPCELKARRDVSKIKLLQRQLAPDEENENQLDVKVLLINEAPFDQPYPIIKIAFSNKNGERVSVKSFSPQSYLEPDSQDKLMPSGSEVHIQFKTELSHPDALGFEFIFE
jgi:predicted Zn finger-like uncharacterized protein